MNAILRAAGGMALAASSVAFLGCASLSYGRMDPPDGSRAFGIEFGTERAAVERTLRGEGITVRAAPDPAALLADRCPDAPVKAPCRLLFSPAGLYAAQVEVPEGEAGALTRAAKASLGDPDKVSEGQLTPGALVAPVAIWRRPGWTVGVSRTAFSSSRPGLAVLRVEFDAAAPPVVAGVPLARMREEVEALLEAQGATVVQRDGATTIYLGCPQGAAEALSCVVHFHDGRATAVTEVHPSPPDDRQALAAWRLLAKRFERDVGRPPVVACPDYGPDRVEADCTATWSSDRLVVVVGAHRNAGAQHRGAISVYRTFTYPPLAPHSGDEETEAAEAR